MTLEQKLEKLCEAARTSYNNGSVVPAQGRVADKQGTEPFQCCGIGAALSGVGLCPRTIIAPYKRTEQEFDITPDAVNGFMCGFDGWPMGNDAANEGYAAGWKAGRKLFLEYKDKIPYPFDTLERQ